MCVYKPFEKSIHSTLLASFYHMAGYPTAPQSSCSFELYHHFSYIHVFLPTNKCSLFFFFFLFCSLFFCWLIFLFIYIKCCFKIFSSLFAFCFNQPNAFLIFFRQTIKHIFTIFIFEYFYKKKNYQIRLKIWDNFIFQNRY